MADLEDKAAAMLEIALRNDQIVWEKFVMVEDDLAGNGNVLGVKHLLFDIADCFGGINFKIERVPSLDLKLNLHLNHCDCVSH